MEKCEKCSRDSKSIYHVDGECPNKTFEMTIPTPNFLSLDAMIAKKFGAGATEGHDEENDE
jgi:hypothetical protein